MMNIITIPLVLLNFLDLLLLIRESGSHHNSTSRSAEFGSKSVLTSNLRNSNAICYNDWQSKWDEKEGKIYCICIYAYLNHSQIKPVFPSECLVSPNLSAQVEIAIENVLQGLLISLVKGIDELGRQGSNRDVKEWLTEGRKKERKSDERIFIHFLRDFGITLKPSLLDIAVECAGVR